MSTAPQPAAYIAVDWGTSNARFALCDGDGRSLQMRQGPGAVESRGRIIWSRPLA